jgi:hypothetical protein
MQGMWMEQEKSDADREHELTQLFWNVNRCWNSEQLSIKTGMTTEYAIQLLVKVRDEAKSKVLHARATKLLNDIIYLQDDLPDDDPMPTFDQTDIGKEA